MARTAPPFTRRAVTRCRRRAAGVSVSATGPTTTPAPAGWIGPMAAPRPPSAWGKELPAPASRLTGCGVNISVAVSMSHPPHTGRGPPHRGPGMPHVGPFVAPPSTILAAGPPSSSSRGGLRGAPDRRGRVESPPVLSRRTTLAGARLGHKPNRRGRRAERCRLPGRGHPRRSPGPPTREVRTGPRPHRPGHPGRIRRAGLDPASHRNGRPTLDVAGAAARTAAAGQPRAYRHGSSGRLRSELVRQDAITHDRRGTWPCLMSRLTRRSRATAPPRGANRSGPAPRRRWSRWRAGPRASGHDSGRRLPGRDRAAPGGSSPDEVSGGQRHPARPRGGLSPGDPSRSAAMRSLRRRPSLTRPDRRARA